jgi:D-alanyl-lipoteichoic acid acyltransferase DltB (MBOAT superfamily)
MRFNSLLFLAFFGVVLVVHNLRLSWPARKLNLLWLSYVFYAAWNPPFVILLWLSTVVDFYLGDRLYHAEGKGRRRFLLVASLVVNLGILSYFKYGEFLVENFAVLARSLGIEWQPAPFDIVLPVGISFYTFQTLSYTLDIYRRRIQPWTSFLDFALFVTFFPQLVAGPIVRAREFLPQCQTASTVTPAQFAWGLYLLLIGLFEKIVLADGLLAPGVEKVFDGAAQPSMLEAWTGAFGFTAQVFCDFSGYSLCAIGAARCLGFELPINFRFPFASVGFRSFWRRWHISLSSWLRDYVYASLRGTTAERTWAHRAFNILVTWGLIGFWHGAGWNYLLWGLLSGALVLAEDALRSAAPASQVWESRPAQFCIAGLTFTLVSLTLLIFRSPSMGRYWELARAIFGSVAEGAGSLLSPGDLRIMIATSLALFLGHWVMRHRTLEEVADRTPWPLKSALAVLMIVLIVLSDVEDRAFVYFQF